jgi:peptidoglycan L-alanyl-D-glutamate endopeptidase CwlK
VPSRDIKDCCEELRQKWPLLQEAFCAKFPGWGMELTCTARPPEEQFELFKKGRSKVGEEWVVSDAKVVVTYVDGFKKVGEHNKSPSRAFDVMLKRPDGSITWDLTEEAWQALPSLVAELGLESGGAWTKFKDFPHVQVKRGG